MRYLSAFLLMALLLAGCSGEEDLAGGVAVGGDGQNLLALRVGEAGWSETPTTITRAGETLNGLRATTGDLPTGYGYGFGLYVYAGATAMMENRQVTWNGTNARWNYGTDAYWPKTSTGETLKAFAYAPYKGTSPWSVTTDGVLSFETALNRLSAVDLLYANDADIDRSTGKTDLDFRHALAKVSLGAVANASSTRDMLVSGITVTGNFYTAGDINLTTGEWSNKTPETPSSQTVTIIDESAGQYIYVPAGGQTMVRTTTSVIDYTLGRVSLVVQDAPSPMIIPGPTVSVTYNYYEQPDLVSPADGWFYRWTGPGGSATKTDVAVPDYANNVGREVGGSATIMGSANVHYLDYADLSDYDKLIVQGTSGMGMRVLMNRMSSLVLVAGVEPSPSSATTTSAAQVFPIPISGLKANSTPTVVISPVVTVVVDQTTEDKAAGKATIKVTLPENASTTDPEYTVTINGTTSADAAFSHAVTITQARKDAIDHYTVSNDGNGGAFVEAWANIGVDGYAVLDLTQYRTADGYVHLNAIKSHYSSTTGTVNKLLLLKKTENRTEKTVTLDNVLTPEQGKDKVLNLRFGKNYEVVIGGAGGASRLMNNE